MTLRVLLVQELRVSECSAAIGGLTFDCDYTLEIAEEEDKRTVISTSFSTRSCDVTPAQGALPCLSLATPLFCIVHATASCHWVRDRGTNADTVTGYRAALSSPVRDDTNITILPPQTREVHYENLVPSTMYTLQIQPITNRGMGKTLSTNFVTHSKILDENVIEWFPDPWKPQLCHHHSFPPLFYCFHLLCCCEQSQHSNSLNMIVIIKFSKISGCLNSLTSMHPFLTFPEIIIVHHTASYHRLTSVIRVPLARVCPS